MNENQPHTISQSIKQEGIKGFVKRFKNGLNSIPPDKLLESEILGYWGNIIATILACIVFLIWPKMWPIALLLVFNIVIQGSQLIGKYQQLNQMKAFKEQFTELNSDKGNANFMKTLIDKEVNTEFKEEK